MVIESVVLIKMKRVIVFLLLSILLHEIRASSDCENESGKGNDSQKQICFKKCNPSLTQVPTEFLDRMPNATIIYFDKNNLTSLKRSDFENKVPNLEEISCLDNQISTVEKRVFLMQPNLRTIHLDRNKIEYLEADTFLTNHKIEFLGLYGNPLKSLSTNIFSVSAKHLVRCEAPITSENIETLDISCRGLTCPLSNSSYEQDIFTILHKLKMSGHQMVQIPTHRFPKMPIITEVDFSNNSIPSLNSDDFVNAKYLSSINCAHNRISKLENGTFASLTDLQRVDLSDNQIKSIDQNLFQNNTKIEYLNLQSNPLTSFSVNILPLSVTSIELHLPSQTIEALDIGCGSEACHYYECFKDADNFQSIRNFNASGNQLENIPQLLSKLGENLEIMDLSRNSVGTLTKDMLRKFTELKELHLSHASLSKVESDAFASQKRLQSLDLSYNQLTEFDIDLSANVFPNLQTLNLEGNRLTKIDKIATEKLPKLNSLAISKNNFGCKYLDGYLKQWKANEKLRFAGHGSSEKANINGINCSLDNPENQATPNIPAEKPDAIITPETAVIIIYALLACVLISIAVIIIIIVLVRRRNRPDETRTRPTIDNYWMTATTNEPYEPNDRDPHYDEVLPDQSDQPEHDPNYPNDLYENYPMTSQPSGRHEYATVNKFKRTNSAQYAQVVKRHKHTPN